MFVFLIGKEIRGSIIVAILSFLLWVYDLTSVCPITDWTLTEGLINDIYWSNSPLSCTGQARFPDGQCICNSMRYYISRIRANLNLINHWEDQTNVMSIFFVWKIHWKLKKHGLEFQWTRFEIYRYFYHERYTIDNQVSCRISHIWQYVFTVAAGNRSRLFIYFINLANCHNRKNRKYTISCSIMNREWALNIHFPFHICAYMYLSVSLLFSQIKLNVIMNFIDLLLLTKL